ncbi:hypothetical protein [Streptomyces sp. NPDC001880]
MPEVKRQRRTGSVVQIRYSVRELRALRVIVEDVCATGSGANRVTEVLSACRLVVCHELFLSGTVRRADAVLPVASWPDKEGTSVRFDRRRAAV